MKKQILILLFGIIHLSAWSQKTIPTDVPCNNAIAEKAKGRWIKSADNLHTTTNQAEVFKRLDAIHQLVLKIYPEPEGVDAVWHRTNRNQDMLLATRIVMIIMRRYIQKQLKYVTMG